MPKSLIQIKFLKYDKFKNPLFNANENTDARNYNAIKSIYDNLEKRYTGVFLPVYNDPERKFSSIKFCKDYEFMPLKNGVYNISYKICKKIKGDIIYLNCHITHMTLVKIIEFDVGEEIDID
tara:strand:+ start:1003 stop:1368 length:366 start_codon:yes stop_codon:yes gene_type:complete